VLSFCHNTRVWRTDRHTDGQTESRQQYRAYALQSHGKNRMLHATFTPLSSVEPGLFCWLKFYTAGIGNYALFATVTLTLTRWPSYELDPYPLKISHKLKTKFIVLHTYTQTCIHISHSRRNHYHASSLVYNSLSVLCASWICVGSKSAGDNCASLSK